MRRLNRLIPVLLLALAGCGGGGGAHPAAVSTRAQPPPQPRAHAKASFYPDDPQVIARATTAGQRSDLARLWLDTTAVRRAAAASARTTLKGDPRVRKATSRFIDDLDRSRIDDLSKNRVIDHAAAAVAPVCGQCFQQLEAMRPIPAIAH